MTAITLSSRFRFTIPKAVREELHLQAGQRFAIITKGDIISLVPILPLEELRGITKGADTSDIRDRSDRQERCNTASKHKKHAEPIVSRQHRIEAAFGICQAQTSVTDEEMERVVRDAAQVKKLDC